MRSETPRLLLVEDDSRIRRELLAVLNPAGFTVEVALTCGEAKIALQRPFDFLLLDLGLPGGDGLELCRLLRGAGSTMPILILTARDTPTERVTGLESGADDYVTKPFHTPELLARIKNLLRRAVGTMASGPLRSRDIWVDPDSRTAGRGEQLLPMKPREYELLVFLLQHPERAWTRAQLLDRVWGVSFDGDERTVDSHVGRLRALVEDDSSSPTRLQTVWGVGYRWRE